MNAADNPTAIALLKAGVGGGKVRYLAAGQAFTDAAGIKGLSVQVLGPPRDQKFLARMDPPKSDRFLRLDANGDVVSDDAIRPFVAKWTANSARGRTWQRCPRRTRKCSPNLAYWGIDTDPAKINPPSTASLFDHRLRKTNGNDGAFFAL